MTNIINLAGKPMDSRQGAASLTDDQIAEAKQPDKHEPRWFRRRREQADQMFANLYREFMDDMNSGKTPGTLTDREAIKREYGHRWAQYAAAELKGPEPIPLDTQAMYTQIQKTFDMDDHKKKVERLYRTPMHLLSDADMEEMDFWKAHSEGGKTTWLTERVMLEVESSGRVSVSIYTGEEISPYDLPSRRTPDYTFDDYTMGEVADLLKALRIGRPGCLTEADRKHISAYFRSDVETPEETR